VPLAQLLPEAVATATRIAQNAPAAVRRSKRAIDMATDLGRAEGYLFELEAYGQCIPTEDREEGPRAFTEKRKPVWKGR